VTLFAFWSAYDDVAGSLRWAQAILSPFKNDPRIAFIELQNEMDTTNAEALTWARTALPCVRDDGGSIPVTLSVSGTDGVAGLERLRRARIPVDFYDLHYYGKAALAYDTFKQATRAAGSLPLFIGETGYSTRPVKQSSDAPDNRAWWEAYQDQYYRTVEYAARAAGLPAVAPWIFSDFPPGAIPRSRSAANPAEYGYGLVHTDGTPKPAAASIRKIFGGSAIDTSFNNGFEQGDGSTPSLPTNWLIYQRSYASFARDSQVAHSGNASARISQSIAGPSGIPAYYLSPVTPIQPGEPYVATVWAKGTQATGVSRLSLAWFDAGGRYLSSSSSTSLPTGTTSWTQLQVTDQAPANAAYVEIHLQSAHNSGTVWFDDVTFRGE
jgi:hypothetical protein